MAKDGNMYDNSPIYSGRKGENKEAYAENFDRIFGKSKKEPEDIDKPRRFVLKVNGKVVE